MSDGDPTAPDYRLAKFSDLVEGNIEEGKLSPADIVAFVFMHPLPDMEKGVQLDQPVTIPKGKRKMEMSIAAHGLAVINKVTPEMLVAIVADIIAKAPTARAAVARLRAEVSMWTFDTDPPPPR